MKRALLLLLIGIFVIAQGMHAKEVQLKDGTYEGEFSFVKVAVTVKDGKISDIKMLHHGGGGEEYAAMVEPLIGRIVQKQSTDVDAVTGATVSSVNLKKAVGEALKKASRGTD